MKPHLRLMGGMCPGQKRSAESCQQSALSYPSPPKFQFISKKELSAVDNQRSALNAYLGVISNLIPKTQYLIPILLLVFVSCSAALAQEPVGHTAPAAKAESEITPLKIGDRVPEELWEMYFPLVSANSDEVQYFSLGDFKDKLIILDFWSTWCGSCIYAFPSNFSLANEFKDDLVIMPVGLNSETEIRKFMATHKNGKYLPESIIDKEILKQYFPHRFIPHYVWIYDGKLESITDSDQLKSAYVQSILNDKAIAIRQKVDVFDFKLRDPLEKNWEKLFEKNMLAKTALTKFVDGIGGWEAVYDDKGFAVHRAINRPLINIYKWAANKPWNYFLNESSDKSIFENINDDPDWFRENSYCYELFTPEKMPVRQRGEIIIDDLNAKLNLKSRLETRMMDCYVLVYDQSLKVDEGLVSVDESTKKMKLDEIAVSFNNRRKFDKHTYQSPPILVNEVQNEEDYLYLFADDIDIESFNAFMKPQGIMAIPAKREIEVFILSDF